MEQLGGIHFIASKLDARVMHDLVAATLAESGLRVSSIQLNRDTIRLTGNQGLGWAQVMAQRLPQRILAEISRVEVGPGVALRLVHRTFLWHRILVALVLVLACALPFVSLVPATAIAYLGGILFPYALLLTVAYVPLVALAIRLLQGPRLAELLGAIQSKVRSEGYTLDRVSPIQCEPRIFPPLVGYAMLIVSLLASLIIIGFAGGRINKIAVAGFVLWLAGAVIIGVASARLYFLIICRTGVDERLAAMEPALNSLVAIIALLVLSTAFNLGGQIDIENWNAMFDSGRLLELKDDPVMILPGKKLVPKAALAAAVIKLRRRMLSILSLTGVAVFIAAHSVLRSFSCAESAYRRTMSLGLDGESRHVHAAVSGDLFLGSIRRALFPVWVVHSVFLIAGVRLLVGNAFGAVWARSEARLDEPAGAAYSMARSAEFICGLTRDHPVTSFLSEFVTICAGLLAIVALGFSVGSYLWSRRTLRRSLLGIPAKRSDRRVFNWTSGGFREKLDQLGIRVAVVSGGPFQASAHVLGLFWRDRIIELSDRVFLLLGPEELDALLAHEASHVTLGHCWRHNLLHFLGRCTLLGGGFVGPLEDSFGNELAADRAAIRDFSVSPAALRECLRKMHAAAAVGRASDLKYLGGIGVIQGPTGDAVGSTKRPGIRSRFWAALRAWLAIYTSNGQVAYWHPSVQQRISALNEI